MSLMYVLVFRPSEDVPQPRVELGQEAAKQAESIPPNLNEMYIIFAAYNLILKLDGLSAERLAGYVV
jgi:hypothetical protein